METFDLFALLTGFADALSLATGFAIGPFALLAILFSLFTFGG